MFDDEKVIEEQPAAQPQAEQPQVEQPKPEEEVTPEQAELDASVPYQLRQDNKHRPVNSEASERNFKAMEQKMRRIERERDEALKQVQAPKPQELQEEPEEEISIGADDIAEGKHVKALAKQIAQLKAEIKQNKQASTTMSAEAMLKAQYPDIDKVVTKDNLDALRDADPEFAEMLDTSSSFRAKAISAYKHIKKLGLYTEDNYVAEREQAQKNANKPKPLASVSPQQGDSPLSRANAFANGLTPELQKQLLKEMSEARKNR
jgi:hypothetical protein